MTVIRRAGRVAGLLASAAGLALLPSAAAAAEGPISGASSNRCNTVTGTYGWTEAGGGTYNTWGSATLVNHPANCGRDWGGQLQYYDATRPSWGWRPLALVLRGQTLTVSLDFKYVLDVRFRVCNIVDGNDDGCGRVQ
ncbi:hypothetical protein NCG97_00590 [Streptomyces lydicamycinicus]|uniref:hypothetical protein n=1 Tax=Streptomyces lydicamycinicus TaxID=1546107 RepID=UPI002035894E|nr:hypothetical protein [Streptomyces lydicamycinicus]URZ99510.1 hypothetical protein NCG97_00590 [Streptomyces lydicamycinicus]